jgi:hypothetical protein
MVATTTRISAKVSAARENRANPNLIADLDSGRGSEVTRKMDKLHGTCFSDHVNPNCAERFLVLDSVLTQCFERS